MTVPTRWMRATLALTFGALVAIGCSDDEPVTGPADSPQANVTQETDAASADEGESSSGEDESSPEGLGPSFAVFEGSGQCMGNDAVTYHENVSGFSSNTDPTAFNCTANDIEIANARAQGGSAIQCVPGDEFPATIVADVVETSNSGRTDIGIWVEDGDNGAGGAENGSCDFFFFDEADINQDPNGVPLDIDGDECGDMDNAGTVTDFELANLNLKCPAEPVPDPVSGEPSIEIASCVSWTQPGGDRVCTDGDQNDDLTGDGPRAGTLPANKSKCNCEPFFVPVELLSTLTLQKTVVNDDGGSASDTDWTLTASSSETTITGVDGDDAITSAVVPGGTYTLSESGGPAGYSNEGWTCTGDGSFDASTNELTLPDGGEATCVVTNDDIAPTLELQKTVVNDDGGTAVEDDFQAKIDGSDVAWDDPQTVTAGSHTASETVVEGYSAGDWGGDCNADGTIDLALDQDAVCTITNDDVPATLTLEKTVVNDDGGTAVEDDFQAKIDGSDVSWDEAHMVEPGTRTASETVVEGYSAGDWGGDCNADGTVSVSLGDDLTCTITNDDIAPTLKLVKTVTNDDGGSAVANDWELTASGDGGFTETTPDADDATARDVIAAVTYSLSESGPAGYTAGAWSCDGGTQSGADITLALDEDVTCTINNDDMPATLTLEKTVVNDDGGTAVEDDFQAKIDGSDVSWDEAHMVEPGTRTASETVVTGYSAGDWGGDCNADGTVDVSLGDNLTCTITNDDIAPTLELQKTVVNDDGGTAVEGDFQAKIDGSDVPWGDPQTVTAGSHTASETVVAGYSAGDWGGDCNADGTINLALDQDAVCTITNDDIAPTLTLEKDVINDDGGSALDTDWTLTASGPETISGAEGDPSITGAMVAAGTYSLSESGGPSGYENLGWSCQGGSFDSSTNEITLGLGESATCVVTNDDIAQCEEGERLTSVSLNVVSASPDPLRIEISDDNPSQFEVVQTVDPASVGTEFTVTPESGTFFDSQNLRFALGPTGGETIQAKNLKVHLSCSDDPQVGDLHSGSADGFSVTLEKTGFESTLFN